MKTTRSATSLRELVHAGYMLIDSELMGLSYGDASNAIDHPEIPHWLHDDKLVDLCDEGFRFIWLTGKTAKEVLTIITNQKTTHHQMLDLFGTVDRKKFNREQPAFSTAAPQRGLYMFHPTETQRFRTLNDIEDTIDIGNFLWKRVPYAMEKLEEYRLDFLHKNEAGGTAGVSTEDLLRHPYRQAIQPSLAQLIETIVAWDQINQIRLCNDKLFMTTSKVIVDSSEATNSFSFLVVFTKYGLQITDDSSYRESPFRHKFMPCNMPFIKIA